MQSYTTTPESAKLKITETITERKQVEKDITLPYYFKDSLNRLCKVINEKHYLQVDANSVWPGVVTRIIEYNKDEICKGAPCTEEEYDIAFDKAITNLQMLNQNDDLPTEEDENVQIDRNLYNQY